MDRKKYFWNHWADRIKVKFASQKKNGQANLNIFHIKFCNFYNEIFLIYSIVIIIHHGKVSF
jgi:hypothetical protein